MVKNNAPFGSPYYDEIFYDGWEKGSNQCTKLASLDLIPLIRRNEIRNYVMWKKLGIDSYMRVSSDFIYTLYTETINSEGNPAEIMEKLETMDSTLMIKHMYPQFKKEYALANNLPLPSMNIVANDYDYSLMATELLTYPVKILEPRQIEILGNLEYGTVREFGSTVATYFNHGLRAIDEHLKRTTGIGILETYSEGPRIKTHIAYDGLIHRRNGETILIEYMHNRLTGKLSNILNALFDYCIKKNGGKATVPRIFGKDLKAIVDSADINEPLVPRSRKGVKTYKYVEGMLGKPVYSEYYPPEKGPLSKTFRKDMESNYGKEAPPCPYVPSRLMRGQYSLFDEDQTNYYLYWRSEIFKGNYHDTDRGYMWLFLTELINMGTLPGRIKGILNGIYRAYSEYENKDHLIETTMIEYSMANGYPLSKPNDELVNGSVSYYLENYMDGNIKTPIDIQVLKDFVSRYNRYTANLIDEDVAQIADIVFRELCEKYSNDGKKPSYRLIGKHRYITVYFGSLLKRYSEDTCGVPVLVGLVDPYGYLSQDLDTCIMQISRKIERYVKYNDLKYKSYSYSKNIDKLIDDSILMMFEEKKRQENWKKVSKISLDTNAIRNAENDLNEVTKLVGVEDDPEEKTPEPEIIQEETFENESPWNAFVNKLSEDQLEYLRKAVNGTRSNMKLEDAINGIAMDTVGDNIVEGGNIVEDYLDDLTGVLG